MQGLGIKIKILLQKEDEGSLEFENRVNEWLEDKNIAEIFIHHTGWGFVNVYHYKERK